MKVIQYFGILLFLVALTIFTGILGLTKYSFSEQTINISNEHHERAIIDIAKRDGFFQKVYANSLIAESRFEELIIKAQKELANSYDSGSAPEGVSEWDYKIGDGWIKEYINSNMSAAGFGPIHDNPFLYLFLTFGLGILGGLFFIIPKFGLLPGIKNNGIYQHALTRGISFRNKVILVASTLTGILLFGKIYMNNNLFWPAITSISVVLILALVLYYQKDIKNRPNRSSSPSATGWLGIMAGIYFILFYILLYWAPQHIESWVVMVSPLSESISGNKASQWFLYGLMYTIIVMVMGMRMIAKYRHNRYQIWRTLSVIFFQTAFAFLIPEILVRLNYKWFDFKNIWPLNYTFFFDWNINQLIESGGMGIFMLVWGIALVIVGVPFFTYFFGKRWYCSWVCGCGGLAETMGDPYRQLSDKSLTAWRYERWIIHGVLLFAVLMTIMVLYSFFTGSSNILFFDSNTVRKWYGFLIGSAFAGVVGTGFYPLMGNRVWCRFGCPLAAYLGLVQKYKSRFRITTNGGQCISCGNCSTYCEMGIDVRWYAQRGQDIVRSSCVGCGVCSAVCPRGVLRLENSSKDTKDRATELRTVHVAREEVGLLY